MILTMTYFEQALSAPELHFKRLRNIRLVIKNGRTIIRTTSSAFEAMVVWEERTYLLFLPTKHEAVEHIFHIENTLRERRQGPLINNTILYEELTMRSSLGVSNSFDIILQEIPCSMPLNEAVLHYDSDSLRQAVEQMKSRLDAIGFRHNNLRPSNIIICKSGVARPLRYWYAEWFDYTDNNITEAIDIIEQNRGVGECKLPINGYDNAEELPQATHYGIRYNLKCGRYGYIDNDGRQITPYIYTHAGNFQENRAIVTRNNKMGAIDCNGASVIRIIFDTLEFDIKTGMFTATKDNYRYLIDYNGKIIHRAKIEGGGFLVAETCAQK